MDYMGWWILSIYDESEIKYKKEQIKNEISKPKHF